MSKVIDVSSKLGEYMLKGWVCHRYVYRLSSVTQYFTPDSDRPHLPESQLQCSVDALTEEHNADHTLLRELRYGSFR
jgi:hypothetical protein